MHRGCNPVGLWYIRGRDLSLPYTNSRCDGVIAIEKIKEYIMQSSVVGFDESGLYCNKRLDRAWIAQTAYFTLVFHGKSRKGKELERMTAVTDRHSAILALF